LHFDSVPTYSVKELNEAISSLILRGFAPRFLLKATVSKCQLKRGHLWMTLTDGESSIDGVVWSSQLSKINFRPKEKDGVLVIGKLNFWKAQARLTINILDVRASISTVLRKFEVVRNLLLKEGLIDENKRRKIPLRPTCIAILTSVPSSALADMLITAKERWPLTKLIIFSIPVQGDNSNKIKVLLNKLSLCYQNWGIQALVLARGGGSREDLMIFDTEEICRELATFPIPIITGIGHEDDLTVADLVADHRSATPTAAIVDLLPSREIELSYSIQKKRTLDQYFSWEIRDQRNYLLTRSNSLKSYSPQLIINKKKKDLNQKKQLLQASSPENWLKRGFSIPRDEEGNIIKSVKQLKKKEILNIQLYDGNIDSTVNNIYT
tara:strand:+ start:472 stop:1614 length:1143 start_codon:yes stop_codon:yes gene_type:complete